MSRSYKKNPCSKDHSERAKTALRESERRIRYTSIDVDIPNGGFWKKNAPQWDICDWKIRETWKSYNKSINDYKVWCENMGYSVDDKYVRSCGYRDWYTRYKGK